MKPKFEKVKLSATPFHDLIQSLDIESRRIPPKDGERLIDWECAYCSENEIIFTQLISDIWEMKEVQYYYLLLIKTDAIYIKHWEWGIPGGTANFIGGGEAWEKFEGAYLAAIANEAAITVTADSKPIFSKDYISSLPY